MNVKNEPQAPKDNSKTQSVVKESGPVEVVTGPNINAKEPIASRWQVLLNLFGATFGISSLGLVALAYTSGLVLFLISLGIALMISYVSYRVLLTYAEKHDLNTFSEFAEFVGGPVLKHMVNVFFIICNLGTMIAALMMFSNTIKMFYYRVGLVELFLIEANNPVWIIVPAIATFPLALRLNLKSFNWITWLAVFACLYFILLLLTQMIISLVRNRIYYSNVTIFNWRMIASSYTYLFYCLTCQLNLIGIFRETRQTSFKSMKPAIDTFTVSFGVIYALIGIFGCIAAFANSEFIKSIDPLLGMDFNEWVIYPGVIFMGITALNAYLYTFKPTKDALFELFDLIISTKRTDQRANPDVTELEQPIDHQLVQAGNSGGQEAVPESVFSARNIVATVILVSVVTLISCINLQKDIGFVDVLTIISDFIIPILFVFIPLGFYLSVSRKIYLAAMLFFAIVAYIWHITVSIQSR